MTSLSFNIATELTDCSEEELAAIIVNIVALKKRLDAENRNADDPTAPPQESEMQILRALHTSASEVLRRQLELLDTWGIRDIPHES